MRALPLLLLVASCQAPPAPPASRPQPSLERIAIAPDAHGFVTATTRRTFHPWGMNYGNAGRLLEDFWDCEWPTLETDLRELQALGANVVRVHLQFGKFLRAPDQPDRAALAQLARLLDARSRDRHLPRHHRAGLLPTGRRAAVVDDAMQEPARWAAQACFWSAVAETCAGNPAVFCYDLANEPISPAVRREPGQWSSGSLFGGFDFLQYIALDPAGRKREDIAAAWIRRMTAAIRVHDRDTLITVGLLPWSRKWQHLSGFLPAAIAPELDFLSVHLYPDSKLPGEALEALPALRRRQAGGDRGDLPALLQRRRARDLPARLARVACGWLGHYDGAPPDELDALERAGRPT